VEIKKDAYLQQLIERKGNGMIKVITVYFLPGIKTRRLHCAETCLAVRNTFPGLRVLIRPLLSSCPITRMSANAHPAEGTSFLCHLAGIT